MPLRPTRYNEVRRKLQRAGFREHTQVGSHVKFIKEIDGGFVTTIVPRHREVQIGTLRSILRQAGISQEDWETL